MANILWETHTHRGDSARGGQSGQDHTCVTDRAKDTSFLVPITCQGGEIRRGKKEYAHCMGLLVLLNLKGLINSGQKTNCSETPRFPSHARYTIHHEQGLCHH